MRVHFAGRICQRDNFTGNTLTLPQQVLIEEGYPASLITFAYPYDIEIWSPVWKGTPEQHLIVDSGAFTAHSQGRRFTTAQLAEFINDFPAAHPYLTSIDFMTLDVIGDQKATWRNTIDLERRGCKVMPVLSGGSFTKKDVDRASEYDYIAIGNIAGGSETSKKPLLDFVFSRLLQLRNKSGKMPRVHLLGLTQAWACRRYPIYSCDSSSWLNVVRWGGNRLPTTTRVPSYAKSGAATAGVKEQLRAEVRHYARMADDATRLWEKRGITWAI